MRETTYGRRRAARALCQEEGLRRVGPQADDTLPTQRPQDPRGDEPGTLAALPTDLDAPGGFLRVLVPRITLVLRDRHAAHAAQVDDSHRPLRTKPESIYSNEVIVAAGGE
jgi:hypothetical protein